MMYFYSTNNRRKRYSLEDAVLHGLAPDGGLFFPDEIPRFPASYFTGLSSLSLVELAEVVLSPYLRGHLSQYALSSILKKAFNFDAPIKQLDNESWVLELFHGPTLAFKDFGARFMAGLLGHFTSRRNTDTVILVATSGDTGSAVASGFFNVPGIKVCILFPKGMVSYLQEKQLITHGGNVTAVEIDGTFDDCQTIVKKAFTDPDMPSTLNLSSANSINIARLLPQMVYYVHAFSQLKSFHEPPVVSVPSGNLGNLCAGLLVKKMGLPVHQFIAANNSNAAFTSFYHTGLAEPKPAFATIANAMDVGNPSNLIRILELYNHSLDDIRNDINAYTVDDEATAEAMLEIDRRFHYVMDPHGATGYAALKYFREEFSYRGKALILHTAHPAKFKTIVEQVLDREIEIPERLAACELKSGMKVPLLPDYTLFKDFLLETYTR